MASNYAYWQKKNASEDYAIWQAEIMRQERIKKNAKEFYQKNKLQRKFYFGFSLVAITKNFALLECEEATNNPFYIATFKGFELKEIKQIDGDLEKAIKVFYLQNRAVTGEALP